jgi:hypothetical protein
MCTPPRVKMLTTNILSIACNQVPNEAYHTLSSGKICISYSFSKCWTPTKIPRRILLPQGSGISPLEKLRRKHLGKAIITRDSISSIWSYCLDLPKLPAKFLTFWVALRKEDRLVQRLLREVFSLAQSWSLLSEKEKRAIIHDSQIEEANSKASASNRTFLIGCVSSSYSPDFLWSTCYTVLSGT